MKRLLQTRVACRHDRAGATLVMMVVALLVLGLAVAALVQTATTQRNALKSEFLRVQAEWLATSAAHRAVLKLQAKSDYVGEVWDVTPSDLGLTDGAQVDIKVGRDSANDKLRLIAIRVEQPPGEHAVVRLTRTVQVGSRETTK